MRESPQTHPNRRRAVAWGLFFGYGGAALTIARNIVLVPFYLHFVSLAQYGAWLATGATVIQLLVSDFGLAGILMQRSAALHGAGDSTRLGVVMGSGMVAGLLLATGLLLIGTAAIPLWPTMPGLSPGESATVTHCLYLAVLASALGIVASISLGLVRSLQRSAAAGAIALTAEVVNIILSAVLLFSGAGLYALVWGMVARALLMAGAATVSVLWVCGKELTFSATRHEVRGLFADTGISLITALAMRSLTQVNTLLVGIVLGPTQAAVYGLTVRAHETLSMVLAQMNAAFAPGMAHLWGSGNTARFRVLVTHIASGSALLAGLGVLAIVCVNESFVKLWVHRGIFGGQTTSILMALAVWLAQIGYVAYDALYAIGKFKIIARTYAIAAALHVGLLICLLRFGFWVVPLVTLLATASWGSAFWKQVASEAQLSRADRNLTIVDLFIIACCGSLVAGVCLSLYPTADSWDGLVIRGICCVLAMLVASLAISGRIRGIIQGELRMTVRSMLARRAT